MASEPPSPTELLNDRRGLPARFKLITVSAGRRLSWGLADQAMSSVTNFVLGSVVARETDAESFGVFTIIWVTYTLMLNLSRGLVSDPLVVRFSGEPSSRWRPATSAATGTALLVGIALGAVTVIVGLVVGGRFGGPLLCLGVVLAGLLLQDAWRFAFFASGQGEKALANDVVCGLALAPGLLLASGTGRIDHFVLAWGAGAAVAAGYGCVQARTVPRPARAPGWCRDQRDLAGRYVVENLSVGGQVYLRLSGIATLAGLVAAGATRGAELLLGPFFTLLMGVSLAAVPEGRRVLRTAPHRMAGFCVLVGSVLGGSALVWGLGVALFLPDRVGEAVLQSVWPPASVLIVPVTLVFTGIGLGVGASVGLRALGAARRSLRAQLIASATYVGGALAGAWITGDALGAAWGSAVAAAVGVAAWWQQLRAGLRDAERESGAASADARPLVTNEREEGC